MLVDEEVTNDPTADQMLLDDPFEDGRVALSVPGAFGINDGDGAAFADAQAVCLRAQDSTVFR
jgi:hypothetical protein